MHHIRAHRACIPGAAPAHGPRIVVELVRAVEDGGKSAQEALDTLAGLGLIERVPRQATT
jgi:hypothetical protein